MKSVVVNKAEALAILRKNRAEHHDIFLEAVEGYKKEAVRLLEDHIKAIKEGKVRIVQVFLPQPVDYTKDYDRAIKMLEMSVNTNVELDDKSFQQYIMDDWSWKDQFIAANSTYSGKAALLK